MNNEQKADETESLNISDETRDEIAKFFLRTSIPRILEEEESKKL